MGYTVFFEQNRPFTTSEWGNIRAAVIPMFNRLKQIKGGNGTGRPIIDNSDIVFNGDNSKNEDHGTFRLSKNGNGFNFCKTARKPYDRFVKAVLIVANFYAPGALEVSCDGDDEPDCWTEGLQIATIYAYGVPGRSPCSPLQTAKEIADNVKAVGDFRNGNLLDGKSPSKWIQDHAKSCDPSHSDPYKGVYPELDNIIKGLEMVSSDSKPLQFLVNYLKANIDDIKDAYQAT
jgi:hypothetical protein